MRFLIDMLLSPTAARWLASQGHDTVHASDLGLQLASDAEIVDRAKLDGRTVLQPTWITHGCWL